MLDFLSEMENFLMLARNSHSYIATVIQKYFEIHNGMSGAEFYGMITDKLKKLKDSDNTFDHSAENLLKKAVSLKSQHEEMIHNLQVEINKLSKKEKRAKSWKNVAFMIFVGAVVGLAIAELVQREVNEARRKETRVAIKELGNIKSSIDGVIKQINSVMYNPSSEMDREQLDFRMKEIKSKLGAFLNKVEDLEKDVEKTKKEIRKARDDVHIMDLHAPRSRSLEGLARSDI
ncbi:UPF0496 protein At4g34330-like [Rosa rugosa]|uniref:UPF0496 protein At4g34330-like n=1 Tax=Rosa rugosa TaxID=74645 RepID=UPI002B40E49B|nr:UPF0496 protein At4g34330-like [Rosa rugosa]